VVGATLDTLASLVDTSLLRYEADGRYQMHDLLRQYAAEQLTSDGDERRLLDQAHAAYYLDMLARHTPDLCFGNQIAAAHHVAAELQNMRAAWQHAIATADVEAIGKAGHGLALFYKFRSRYRECADAMEQARQMLDAQPPTEQRNRALVMVLTSLGFMQLRLGHIDYAQETFQQSSLYARRLERPLQQTEILDPALGLSVVALTQGDYAEAVRLAEDVLQRSKTHHYAWYIPYAWLLLTNVALAQGHYRAARHAAQQAYAAVQVAQDHWLMAYILNDMGTIALAMGNVDEARQYYQDSYALRERFGAHEGMALALTHLARVALQQDDYAEAHTLYERSLTLYRQIGNRGGLATVLNGLGNTACALGDTELARRSFHQALQTASEIQFVPLILTILTSVSECLLAHQQPERALELLTCVLRHPASDRDTNDQAQRLLVQAADTLAPEVLASTYQQRADLQTLVDQMLVSLATSQISMLPAPAAASAPAPARPPAPQQPEQPLVEALTEREQEVLHLIAEGYANQAIAEALTLSLGTIKWYTTQIYSKLAVRGRTQALARARELRLLP
jgi:ATP/maltotriose-dependent transcriptional regulator MalT